MVTENEVVLAIDRVRAMLGELKSMAHNYAELKRSRDRWKQFADERDCELITLKAERDACWVKLPVDANGEPIRPGDMVGYFGDGVRMRAYGVCEEGIFYAFEGADAPEPLPTSALRHFPEAERTVEDVLEDCISDWENGRFESHEELAARHAREIRELLGVEYGK